MTATVLNVKNAKIQAWLLSLRVKLRKTDGLTDNYEIIGQLVSWYAE